MKHLPMGTKVRVRDNIPGYSGKTGIVFGALANPNFDTKEQFPVGTIVTVKDGVHTYEVRGYCDRSGKIHFLFGVAPSLYASEHPAS